MQLADYLERHQISVAALADKIGVAQWTLRRYISGRTPRMEIALAIEKATGGEVKAIEMVAKKRRAS